LEEQQKRDEEYKKREEEREKKRLEEEQKRKEREEEWEKKRLEVQQRYAEEKKKKDEEYALAKKQADEEWAKEKRAFNMEMGRISEKQGKFVEDIVYPSMPRIIREDFNENVIFEALRPKKKLPDGRNKEYDVLVETDNYIYLNSTKSDITARDVKRFIKDIAVFYDFFPHYQGKPIIGVVSSLYFDKALITYAERLGFIVLAVGDTIMDVKNSKDFKPRIWKFI
ncbi:MAG: hypothetical protein L3V56_14815, partial [Candidatus Magnetoovum sp. WYHC-5]|nr:hypothetical protein [Candidatus Magnetoovum sp. WYHC-5]